MEPVEALAEIAFLLEAADAEPYRVRAFRRAAASAASAGPGELARLHATKQLESLDGVGTRTAGVIAESLEGGIPSYLEKLRAERPAPPEGAVGSLLGALRGDCHAHSDWSDGGATIAEMALAARALDREYQALTDHSPRLTIAHGLDRRRLLEQLDVVEDLNDRLAPFRLLTGIEVDILDDGSLDQDADLLGRLDVVVASVHSKLQMERAAMTVRMLAAVRNPLVDILGHCTGRIVSGRGRPESAFDHEAVFAACAEHDTAVEINSRPDRRDPRPELVRLARDAGCRFAVDTDAHAPGQLTWQRIGCEHAASAGLPAEAIVNAMDLDGFLSWLSGHR